MKDVTLCVMSLIHSFSLWQFSSPFFSFFWLFPGFVEVDEVVDPLGATSEVNYNAAGGQVIRCRMVKWPGECYLAAIETVFDLGGGTLRVTLWTMEQILL